MSSSDGSLSVFVGNLPYNATEDQMADIFRSAGEVVRFRIIIDPSTGKGKGFGFADFANAEGAQVALKTLNGYELGDRKLRVDTSATGGSGGGSRATGSQPSSQNPGWQGGGGASSSSVKQTRDIDTALSQLTIGEVYDVLVDVKEWVKKDPDGVRDVLEQRPVLAQALLKMQTTLGMMQSPPLADLSFGAFQNAQTQGFAQAAPNQQPQLPPTGGVMLPMPPQQPQLMMPGGGPPPLRPMYPSIPATAYPPPIFGQAQPPFYGQMLPQQSPPGFLPPPQSSSLPPHLMAQQIPPPGYAPPPAAGGSDEMVRMIRQVMSLTEAQISAMPPQQQAEIRAIRSSGAGVR